MSQKKICRLILLFLFLPGIAFAAGDAAIDTGNTSWMLISTALVLLMMPGLAMFYGGLLHLRQPAEHGQILTSFSYSSKVWVPQFFWQLWPPSYYAILLKKPLGSE